MGETTEVGDNGKGINESMNKGMDIVLSAGL
jgi:hypothetical protein